eukprot:tig00021073_g18028.t1
MMKSHGIGDSSGAGPRKRQRTGAVVSEPAESAANSAPATEAANRAPSAILQLPDELLIRIFLRATMREWSRVPPICAHALLDPEDADPEPEFRALMALRRVCRHFRQVASSQSLWERIALRRPTDADCAALAALPDSLKASIRGLALWEAQIERDGVHHLRRGFKGTLKELTVLWEDRQVTERSKAALPAISEFQSLEILHLQYTRSAAMTLCDPWVRCAMEPLALVRGLKTLILSLLPISVDQLKALGSLADSLRNISFSIIADDHAEENGLVAEVCSAVAQLPLLERLRIGFVQPEAEAAAGAGAGAARPIVNDVYLNAGGGDLRPLSRLSSLTSLVLYFNLTSLAFLEGLTIQHLTATVDAPATEAAWRPLSTLAPTLKSLTITLSDDGPAAFFAPAVLALTNLEALEMNMGPPALSALAAHPLRPWGALRTLVVDASDADQNPEELPPDFVGRVGADLPKLRSFWTRSPLPLPGSMLAVASLRGLQALRLGPDAVDPLRAEEGKGKAFLAGLLPDVAIQFDERAA